MKYSDMIQGEIYFLLYRGSKWLLKFSKININFIYADSINLETGHFYSYSHGRWGIFINITELRLATEQEKQHVELCIKENKYVSPFKEVIYEIF